MRSVAALFLILFTCQVSAQGPTLSNPTMGSYEAQLEQLRVTVAANGECPFTESELDSAVASQLLRARVKRAEKWTHVTMRVDVGCLKVESVGGQHAGYAVDYSAQWCMDATPEFGTELMHMCAFVQHGGRSVVGASDKQYLIDSVMGAVSSALDDFLKSVMAAKETP